MATLAEIKAAIRQPYAWPGGYPLYCVMGDGESMSLAAVRAEWREVVRAHLASEERSGWFVSVIDVNWEDAELSCAHTSEPIECAYAPDPDPLKAAEHWHGGQSSGLYRVVCNGGVVDAEMAEDAASEIESILASDPKCRTVADSVDLEGLRLLMAECKAYPNASAEA